MTFDFKRMCESKLVQRERLASGPIAEKLRILDALRQRALAIRGSGIDTARCVSTGRDVVRSARTSSE